MIMRTLKMKLILYVLKEIHSSVTLLSISKHVSELPPAQYEFISQEGD